MKNLKKILALVTALALTLALALPAFAAEGDVNVAEGKVSVSVDGVTVALPEKPTNRPATEVESHTYTAYQIFAGDYAANDAQRLGVTGWGTGVNGEALLTALKANNAFGEGEANLFYNAKTAVDVANVLVTAKNGDNLVFGGIDTGTYNVATDGSGAGSDALQAFVAEVNAHKTTGTTIQKNQTLGDGYYLIVDATENATGEGAINLSFLTMGNDTAFAPRVKVDVPELKKQVLEINDSNANTDRDNYKWADAADHDIGDTVYFTLTGTLPTNYADFKAYQYYFTDTFSSGLTVNEGSIKVYVNNGNTVTQITPDDTDFTQSTATSNGTFTVKFYDLKALQGVAIDANSLIQVVYTATLNTNAVVKNVNSAKLSFTNDPTYTSNGTPDNPPPPPGDTPDSKVTVFTFALTFDKTQEDGVTALAGAGFTLYKYDAEYTNTEGETTDADKYLKVGNEQLVKELVDDKATFRFPGLDAGKYKLVESTVPAGYNKADDMYFTITADYETNTNGEQSIKSLTFSDVTKDDMTTVLIPGSAVENGVIAEIETGTFTTTIANQRGLVLPSTGGIGTTIFYVVGGLLVLGAGVLLITKKRMGRSE